MGTCMQKPTCQQTWSSVAGLPPTILSWGLAEQTPQLQGFSVVVAVDARNWRTYEYGRYSNCQRKLGEKIWS